MTTPDPITPRLPEVRCNDTERLADYAESGEPFLTYHVCGKNALRHVAQLDADREAAERDVEQATWEEAVANGEPWADTCTCPSAEVESGRCVLCGKHFPVGGSV